MVGSALGKDFGLQKGFTKGLANLVFDPEETAAEADKTIEETKKKLATLKNEAAGFEIALQQQSDKSSKTAKDNNDLIAKANADAKKLALEQQQQLDAKLEEIAEQNYLKTLSDQEREERLVKDKYFELETLAKDNADALADIVWQGIGSRKGSSNSTSNNRHIFISSKGLHIYHRYSSSRSYTCTYKCVVWLLHRVLKTSKQLRQSKLF
jgi:hypothetical protein